MTVAYQKWLKGHLKAAMVHYNQLCKLDDQEQKTGGSSEYFEQAHQMFGYIAALETCLKQVKPKSLMSSKHAIPAKKAAKRVK